jgi:hypothetical protein
MHPFISLIIQDLAGKFGPLVGTGTTVTGRYVDSSLVMKQTRIGILGRSIVIHDGETGARLACGKPLMILFQPIPIKLTHTSASQTRYHQGKP